jgi:hypothetical protein
MLRIVLGAIASLFMVAGALAQDGARAYFLLPEDTNIVSLTAYGLHVQAGATNIDTGVLSASYRRIIDVGGNAGAILIGLPVGALSGAVDTGFGVVPQNNSVAVGDLYVGGELGLFGSPPT